MGQHFLRTAASSARTMLLAALLGACVLGVSTTISGAAGGQGPGTADSGDPAPPADAGLPSGVDIEREDVSLRTEKSRTYETSDGRRLTKVFLSPVNSKDADGKWHKIDTDLEAGANSTLETKNTDFDLSLPETLDSGAVRVADDGEAVAFSLKDAAASKADVDGSEARYENALNGVDATYTAGADSVKEILTLKNSDTPNLYEFELRVSDGLTPRKDRDGSISIVDGKGNQSMVIPAPTVEDAKGATTNDISFDLEKAGAAWNLAVEVDRKWLGDEQRAYPVKVDPSLYTTPLQDCTIRSNAPSTSSCSAATNDTGSFGGSEARSLFSFDVNSAIPKGARIQEAELYQLAVAKASNAAQDFGVYRLTRPFSSTATWNAASSGTPWTTAGGDVATTPYRVKSFDGSNSLPAGWYLSGLGKLVQEWRDGKAPNYGLMVKGQSALNRLTAESSETSDPHNTPYLGVYWDHRPGLSRQFTQISQRLNDRMGVSVNAANGNLNLMASDLKMPGTGIDLDVSRNFNNLSDIEGSEMGEMWRNSAGGSVSLVLNVGGDKMFVDETGAGHLFRTAGSGTYISPTGINATLVETGGELKLSFDQSKIDYFFNHDGDLLRKVDRNGNTITYTYASQGKLSSIKDTRGRTTTLTYNGSSQLSKVTDPAARNYQYAYNGSGDLSDYTDPAGRVTHYDYDSARNLSQIKDPLGVVTRMEYDSGGRVTELKRNYNVSSQAYTARWRFAYAAADASCASADITKTIVTDPRGNQTTYCFDTELRASRVTDAKGRLQSNTYNANSDLTQNVDGAATSTAEYNSSTNDLTKTTSPAGEVHTLAYDGINGSPHQPTMSTNAQGSQTQFAYSTVGNLTTTGDGASPSQISATLEYNGDSAGSCPNDPNTKKGTLRCAIDGNSNKTFYSYDTQGRLIKVTPPAGIGATTMTYDSADRLKNSRDGKGQTTSYQYDNLDRKTRVDFSDGSYINYIYDANGNRTSRIDSVNGTSDWTYDALNRRSKDTLPVSKITNYTYDANSNLTSLADTTGTTSYGYDETNQLSTLTQPDGGQATFGYDGRDNLTTTNYPNGVVESRTYDTSNKTRSILARKGAAAPLTDFTYTYILGAKETELQQTMKDKTGNTTSFTYDGLDRLWTATTRTPANAVTADREWTYDNASNRTSEKLNGTTTRSFAFSPSNQPCVEATNTASPGTCSAPASGAKTFNYDANGNRLGGSDGSVFAYNARNQNTSVKPDSASGAITQAFQGEGQSEQSGDGSRKLYTNALGVGLVEGDTWGRADMVRKPSGELFSTYQYGERRYQLKDTLGSTRNLSTETGGTAGEFSYDPWGNSTATGQSSQNMFYYASGYRATSGFTHFGARFYSARSGAWTQADILDQPGDLTQANRYQYAGDNPVNVTDTNGCKGLARCLAGCVVAYCRGGALAQCLGEGGGLKCFLTSCEADKLIKCGKRCFKFNRPSLPRGGGGGSDPGILDQLPVTP